MAEQTVREQLVAALENILRPSHAKNCMLNKGLTACDCGAPAMARRDGQKALDRHRAEPEGCICDECPVCAVSVRECQCYGEGTQAQRERVGGGTA